VISPWPCRHGDPAARRYSSLPGPARGAVTARWRAAGGVQAKPVLTSDLRVAVGDASGVVLLDPRSLTPVAGTPIAVPFLRSDSLAATSHGLAVVTRREAFLLAPDLSRPMLRLAAGTDGAALRGVIELDDGDLLAWTDEGFARFSSSREVRYRQKVRDGMFPAVGQAAVAPDGTVYVANAMVWVDDDDMERIGHLAAFRGGPGSDGQRLFFKEHDRDGLPTGAGDDLRLIVLVYGAVLAERGLVRYDPEGRETWAETDPAAGQPVALVPPRTLVYGTASRTRLLAQELPEPGQDAMASRTLLVLERGERITSCAAAAGRVYASTNRAVVAVGLDGGTVFQVPDLPADDLILGDGWLLAVQPDGLVRVD
jgi:hypothetical protein